MNRELLLDEWDEEFFGIVYLLLESDFFRAMLGKRHAFFVVQGG